MTLDTLTSAAGSVLQRSYPWPICVSGTASIPGTVSVRLWPSIEWECLLVHTNSGFRVEEQFPPSGSAIMELRRISGFTWEQLAKLFGVTRRSVHFWASGKPLNAENEEHLQHILATIRRIDRGNSSENRAILLSVSPDGTTLFDFLVSKKYNSVLERLGSGIRRIRPELTPISRRSRAARTPPRPDGLVGALHDTIHTQKGRRISASPIRTKRRE